jgi:predicted ATPase/DNA-binding SARP family transcriptional activator
MDSIWRIELLGGLRAIHRDQIVARFSTRRAATLLAYLAFYGQRPHPREALMELLWPEGDPRTGRHRLRQALHSLRCQLEPPGIAPGAVIIADAATARINLIACITDVAEFESEIQAAERTSDLNEQAQRLDAAAALYRGELLPGYFDEWVLQERPRLAEAFLQVLHALSTLREAAGDHPRALQWARRAVVADPLREESHRELIRLLIAADQPEAAWRQYEELKRLLALQLGVDPAPETHALLPGLKDRNGGALLQRAPEGGTPTPEPPLGTRRAAEDAGSQVDTAADAAPVGTAPPADPGSRPAVRAGHLPLQLTRFFGREREIEQLCQVIGRRRPAIGKAEAVSTESRQPAANGPRLVTLTGPGGTGKTRLAIQAAQQLREAFPGGVWFVPLLDVADPRLILDRLLDTLCLSRSPHMEPLGQIAVFLSSQPALFLLDNFEHLVVGGAETVKTLLGQIESLWVLATSRQRLNVPGEREFPVPALPVPEVGGVGCKVWGVGSGKDRSVEPYTLLHPTPYTLAQCPSVQLFLDRAQAVRPDFQVTARNAASVAALCRQLEGLPLALELAAARAGVLTLPQMLARLSQRFELLVSRARGIDPRHRSLRAALDWSCHLLSPEQQRFFARLSVFRGGWSLEAAEAVCEPAPALEYLQHLRECSLVQVTEAEDEMRFHLLETLREYAHDRLREGGEEAAVRTRHLDFFLTLAEKAQETARRPDKIAGQSRLAWLDRLTAEHENLRVALSWAERVRPEHGLRLSSALRLYWRHSGRLSEGREWLERALAATENDDPAPAPARVRVLSAAGFLAFQQGDYDAARTHLEASVALARRLGDMHTVSRSLSLLGRILHARCETARGLAQIEEALALAREIQGPWVLAACLMELGIAVGVDGDCGRARVLFEECLALLRGLEDTWLIAWVLQYLGSTIAQQGDLNRAQALLEESLALAQETKDEPRTAAALGQLGFLAWHRGECAAAAQLWKESLSLNREAENGACAWGPLFGLSQVAAAQGQSERAVRLLAFTEARREAATIASWTAALEAREQHLTTTRAALAPHAFAVAWAEGQAMTLGKAVTYALAERDGT